MFYIRSGEKLQRTARWIESLPGGIKYLQSVLLDDKLGICASLEAQMQELVGTFFDEWKETVHDPSRRKHFQQFANTTETLETVELEVDRGQMRPVFWPKESVREDFAAMGRKWSSLKWEKIVEANAFKGDEDGPNGASVCVKRGDTQLAVFKIKGRYFATQQMCPHKRAFVLSDGLVGESTDGRKKLHVSCPLHKRNYNLSGADPGKCQNDAEVSIATFEVEERWDGWVWLRLPGVEELDGVLGTRKWMVRKGEGSGGVEGGFEELDRRFGKGVGRKARKVGSGGEVKVDVKVEGGSIDW